jgi:hypothetical protein
MIGIVPPVLIDLPTPNDVDPFFPQGTALDETVAGQPAGYLTLSLVNV